MILAPYYHYFLSLIDLDNVLSQSLDVLNIPRERLTPLFLSLSPFLSELSRIIPAFQSLNAFLKSSFEPLELILLTLLASTFVSVVYAFVVNFDPTLARRRFFSLVRSLPGVRSVIRREKAKAVTSILTSRKPSPTPTLYTLPETGTSPEALFSVLQQKAAEDVVVPDGLSRLSGTVYYPGAVHKEFLDRVYSLFSTTNPIHGDAFPSIRQMEAEVVAMTAGLLGGGPTGDGNVCGAMTSGGTDSILCAMKASRDYMLEKRRCGGCCLWGEWGVGGGGHVVGGGSSGNSSNSSSSSGNNNSRRNIRGGRGIVSSIINLPFATVSRFTSMLSLTFRFLFRSLFLFVPIPFSASSFSPNSDLPEIVIAESAHAAYWKAAEYFHMRLRVVKVGPDFRLRVRDVKKVLNRNTAVIVASAPGYPHGVIDHVADLGRLARRHGVCLHVDACLGGFALPFLRDLGHAVPPFDFGVPGVTSMSVDTHKFGMAHKGTSVVLYRNSEIRKHQYTQITEWTGGLYISPGMAGSRPGALIATAWAAMVRMGRDGYRRTAAGVLAAAQAFARGIEEQIPELEVVGKPDMYVVAFRLRDKKRGGGEEDGLGHSGGGNGSKRSKNGEKSPNKKKAKDINIYQVNEELAKKGWHFNALQCPPALHFCFTAAHSTALVRDQLIPDLKAAVAAAAADPDGSKKGSVPLYGMANASPDRGLLGEFLTVYQDTMLMP